jgi:3-deoxy-D-manno-octulosonic-acid transferase
VLPLVLKRRLARGKEHPQRWREKLGVTDAARPPGRLAWLHGASVGEGLSLLPLVEALRVRAPDLTVLVTSGTVTSAELLARRLPAGALHQFAPLDSPVVARRFLAHWRPELAVFAESEIWPSLLTQTRGQGVRTALVSARLSQASLDGWGRFPASARALFSGFNAVLAQDDAAAAALAWLGARDDGRLNLKLCGAPLPVDEAALARLRQAAAGRPVLLAASTHAGEEAMVLDAFAPLAERALLVIVPRHPERGAAVAALAAARGFSVSRQGAGEAFGSTQAHVADALGELGPWFRLAASTLVAGSLLPGPGGHNPLEPARLCAPQLAGPQVQNWAAVYAALGENAPRVSDAESLGEAWRFDLDAPDLAARRAERALTVCRAQTQVLDAAADRLAALLEPCS